MYIIWHSRLYKPLYSHVAMHTFNTVCNKKKRKKRKNPEKEHEQAYSERVHW